VIFVTLTASAGAHHAAAPVYDGQRVVTVEGVVTEFRFINPHAMMSLDVTDAAGSVVKWTVEFQGRLNLTEIGWTEKTITPGERVTVSGNPTHTGSPRMLFARIIRADGTELLLAAAIRAKEIGAVRRQRRQERQRP
jgi:hypothetical protein